MNAFDEQNHYEFLGVQTDAPPDEIRRAVGKLREMFAPGSIALYSLVDQEEHKALLARLEEAYVVLSDERARAAYDERHGLGRKHAEGPRKPRPGPAAQLELPAIVDAVDVAPAWPGVAHEPAAPPPAAAATPELLPAAVDAAPEPGPAEASEPLGPGPSAPVVSPEEPAAAPALATGDEEIEVDVELFEAEDEGAAAAAAPPVPPTALVPASAPAAAAKPRAPELPPLPELGPTTEYTGELLRRIREARGLSLRELATRTRISLGHLEHVEAEAFRELPERVYLRGFLHAYARELKLDGARLSETYLARWAAARR